MFAWANREAVERTLATRPRLVLEPFARRALGEGRDQRQRPRDRRRPRGLRRRRAALPRHAERARLPHRQRDLLGRAARASRPRWRARSRRGATPTRQSYVARLLDGPREHAARKVGEEATEVLLAAPGSDEQVGEVADLVFHALVLLARDGRDPLDVFAELARRHVPQADGA